MAGPRITAAMCAFGRGISEPRLSPDGTLVAFVATVGGRGQLVVAAAEGGPELVVTSDPAPRPSAAYGGGAFDWTPDGRGLVYSGSDGGLWSVAATGGPSRAVVAAAAAGPAAGPSVRGDGAAIAYVLDQGAVGVVALDLDATGAPAWPQVLSTGADFCFDPTWSPDGRLVAWHEWDVPAMPWDASRIVVRRVADAGGAGAPVVVAGGDDVQVQQPRFSPDGTRLAFLSDATGWLNLWLADVDGDDVTGARVLVDEPFEHGDASWGLGQRSFAWAPDGRRLAFARNEGGFGRLCEVDVASGSVVELGKGVHGGLSWAGDRIAAIRSGARTPTQVVVYERGERRTIARGPVAGFEAAHLVEPELVDWAGDDGGRVHGRLYRPVVTPATGEGRLPPLLVWVHGGPTDQWPVTFIPRVAYFLERGWAVLVADHRGSTGWGRAYTQAMAGRWGELDVADVAAGMRAAAAQGWADPARMVPIGGSAGGFTVLNLLAHHPDLCAAGVELFGVADLLDLDETTHRFEAHYLHSVVGPLPDKAQVYRDRSPVTVSDRIESPLLILQGDADKVVPPAQSKAIADRLERLGRTVELHLYEGEGHGWGRPETIMDELDRTESFLTRHVLRWLAPTKETTS